MYIPTGVFERSTILKLGAPLQVVLSDRYIYNFNDIAKLTLRPNGEMEIESTGGTIIIPGQWASPRETMLGDGFEVRMTTVSGTLTSGTIGTWELLDEDRVWTLNHSYPPVQYIGTLEIRAQPGSGSAIATATITMQTSADNTYLDLASCVADGLRTRIGTNILGGGICAWNHAGDEMFCGDTNAFYMKGFDLFNFKGPQYYPTVQPNNSNNGPSLPIRGIKFSADGLNSYTFENNFHCTWSHPTPFVWAGRVAISSVAVLANQIGACMTLDGTQLYVHYNTGNPVRRFDLTTAWDCSVMTAHATSQLTAALMPTSVSCFDISKDKSRIYICHSSPGDGVSEFIMASPGQLNTIPASGDYVVNYFLNTAAYTGAGPQGISVSNDQLHLLIAGVISSPAGALYITYTSTFV